MSGLANIKSCLAASIRAWLPALLMALLVCSVADAGQVSFSVTSTAKVTGVNVEAIYELTNTGPVAAANVSLRAVLLGMEREVVVAHVIAPAATVTCSLSFVLPNGAKGSFPLAAYLRYTVPGGATASAVTLATVRTEKTDDKDNPLILAGSAGERDDWGLVRLNVTSRNPQLGKIIVKALAPEHVTFSPSVRDVRLLEGRGSLKFNGELIPGAGSERVVAFFIAEYDLDGRHSWTQIQLTLTPQPTPLRALPIVLGGLLLCGLFAAQGWRNRHQAQPEMTPADSVVHRMLEVAALVVITLFIAFHLNLSLLLTPTTTTGGDTGSHYYTLWYLRHVLLPAGKISSWTPGNYAGFPILQFYFPLSFLLMCLLDLVLPLQVAFKLISLAGVFLTPMAAFLMLRLMRLPFPAPAIGAAFTLPFLMNTGNSMWGGNVLSTLAGEFSYSLSMALSLILLGSLYRGGRENTRVITNAILVFLVGFSHGYTLLFAEAMSLFLLFTPKDFFRRLIYLVKVYALGFCLLAFWLVPLLAFSRYTTPYHTAWTIHSLAEIVPSILAPFVLTAVLGAAGLFIWGRVRRQMNEGGMAALGFLGFGIAMAVLMFAMAPKLGVVDIRYVPYAQLLSCLIAAVVIGQLAVFWGRVWLGRIILILAVGGTLFWAAPRDGTIAAWIRWNYEGFEVKPAWPLLQEIVDVLREPGAGDDGILKQGFNAPRVVFEHSPDHNQFGTTRVFESLPLFAGRATLEGLYMQASISAPFVFFIQSETSRETSAPFPQYSHASIDFARARKHLALFNVRELILKSDEAKRAIRETSGYGHKKTIGDYELWEFTANHDRYVEPLNLEPVFLATDDWKAAAYRWFTDDKLVDVPLVFTEPSKAGESAPFRAIAETFENLPHIPIDTGECRVTEEIENDEIRFRTNCIGKPHLVKMSYHPNWRVEGADRIHHAAPSFMLVYPTGENVHLFYGRGWADWLGRTLTVLGIFVVFLTCWGFTRGVTS